MDTLTYIATSTMGMESLVGQEVKSLGYEDVKVENGKVTFSGPVQALCRANLWLRTADRVKIQVGQFKATSFEELFEQTKSLPWETFLTKDAEFPVIGRSVKSKLYSVPDCQSIVKKAVVERLKQTYHRDWFEENGPFYRIEVALHKDTATLTIDTTGDGLHKRGYRPLHSKAPLKETLAAGMIKLTNWHVDRPFVDPFCGSGTLPIEAAMIGQNIAPGFNRTFTSEKWPFIPQEAWDKAREEAEDLADYDRELDILGSDINHNMIELSNNNAMEAGLYGVVQFKQMRAQELKSSKEYGTLIANPPYGNRLGEKEEVEKLYREFGEVVSGLDTWSKYILTAHENFEKHFGKNATKRRKLYNGNIKTQYYQYWGPRPPRKG